MTQNLNNPRLDPATRCVHAGMASRAPEFGLNTPVVTSTAFDYTRDGEVRYPRYLNTPNHHTVAAKIAALEQAEDALVTASGLGAISAVLVSLLGPGDHAVVLDNLYGGTSDLIDGLLKPWGVAFSGWDGDPASLPGLLRPETRLALIESPTNPLIQVVDLAATAGILRRHGVTAVVDNTFATPVLQQPLCLGFDLVVHSGTKYLGGHSDLLCGAVAGSAALIERIRPQAIRLGACLNGQDLALLERSLKTLAIRVQRQSENALRLATWLAAQDTVAAVYYPGLETDPGHTLARRQMSAFGGMLAFRLAETVDAGVFMHRLRLIAPAVSLGGVESTLCQPRYTSHAKLAPERRAGLGIDDRLIRLSTGIEGVDDLVADLDQALAAATRTAP